MIAFFTFTESWGILDQNHAIRKDEKGDSVSNTMFLYTMAFFLMSIVWGWHLHSAAVIFNATITGAIQLPVLLGLYKHKGFSFWEKLAGATFALMPLWMLATPYRSESYLAFSFGCWYAFGAQLWELWYEGKTGELRIKLFLMYLLAGFAWVTYALAGDDLYFKIAQVGLLVLLIAINTLWCVWRLREPNPPWMLYRLKQLLQKDPA